jgi:hypothetical protein
MGPRIVQHDNLDKLPAGAGSHEREPWARPARAMLDWRGLAVLCGFLLIGGLFAYWLIGRDVREWISYSWGGLVVKGALVVALLFLAKHWMLVEQPGGYKVFWFRVNEQRVIEGMLHSQQVWAARDMPNVAQLTLTNPQAPKVEQQQHMIEAETITTVPMLPPSEWLTWFDSRPHGLLAAETGGGKSTTVKAVLKSRMDRGELVFLIDPHSSDWFGLPSIGGGEDWEAVWAGMKVVIGEYTRRMQERDLYLKQNGHELPHNHFPRINVLLDEANTACRKLSIAKRGEETKWEQFAEALGSGARKVGLSIQLLAQSANVEDIGLSGPMRQNFTRLALDAATTRLMIQREETDAARKKELHEALVGVDYPATAQKNGQVILLDRRGLDQLGAPANPRAALWTEGYEKAGAMLRTPQIVAQHATRPVVSASVQTGGANATVRASVAVSAENTRQTEPQTGKLTPDRKQALIAAMKRSGRTRKEARGILLAMGEGLDNDDWADAA